MHSTSADSGNRLFFLDWVRIIAFFVLIFYHVGMYYVSWDWHVKSPYASNAIDPLMLLSSPWRLGLLFLVSGVASSFMLTRSATGSFLRQRTVRLLAPLIFGIIVIVPPQAYLEIVEKIAYSGSYAQFMPLYLTGYGGFCRGTDCLYMPTWNHLWFIAYLWVYTLALGAIDTLIGPRFSATARRISGMLKGWRLIVLPALGLGLARMALQARFPTTHALIDDWYNHAHYFSLFVLGAMLARDRAAWMEFDAMRWRALGIALCSWAVMVICFALPGEFIAQPYRQTWWMALRVVYALCGWCAIVAACGFAHRHLQFDSARRRYLTQAVFPVYILHQSLIVVLAHSIKPANLAPATEGLVLVVLTLGISLGVFELVRRCRPLHLLLGIGSGPAIKPAEPQAPRAAIAQAAD
jgi:glucan biosynthesis protein C